MKTLPMRNSVTILSVIVIVLALVTALAGLLDTTLYQDNTISLIAQGKGQDLVTAVIAVPATIICLIFALRGSIRGKMALAGLLGYFLYTYVSYAFLWKFNYLFIAYVAAFSASLFAFIVFMHDLTGNDSTISIPRSPAIASSVLLFLVAGALLSMWLSQIISAMQGISVPIITDTDAHLVIQGLDLGILVPLFVLIGVMLLRKNSLAYIWLPVLLVKGLTMGLAIVSMTIFMARAGTPDMGGAVMFGILTFLFLGLFIWVFMSMRIDKTAMK